jgi:CubicO group peptidase (beta-lactamase class C family)
MSAGLFFKRSLPGRRPADKAGAESTASATLPRMSLAASDFTRRDVTLANWREHPFSRWSFQNVEELVPSARLDPAPGSEPPSPGPGPLAEIRLRRPDGCAVTVVEHLERSHTDGLVALRDGAIVAEWHAPHFRPGRPHLVFSISKSITGMLSGILADRGLLDPESPVAELVPAQPGSAYETARVRHLLDMTVAIAFTEDYLDRSGPFDRYRRAMLWNPERPDSLPERLADVLASLPRGPGEHGDRFTYASPNTDILGLVLEAAAGRRYHEMLAEWLWAPMGARGPALVTVDRAGTARAAGGVAVTLRDLARFGQMIGIDAGRSAEGRRVVPAQWIEDISAGACRQAWRKGEFADMFAEGSYRSSWYNVGDGRGTVAAIGIHGQWIWADPTSGVVLAKVSSRPAASDDAATALEISMLGQLAQRLR